MAYSNNKTVVYVPGKVYWPKIVGDRALHDNYEGTAREWSFELEPEDVSFLKDAGLLDRLKEGKDGRGDYLNLRKPEFNKDGEKNDPIRIYDSENMPWDETRMIGNGTKVVAKLTIMDWGRGKKKSIWTTAIRVQDLVPYETKEFGAYDNGDEEAAPTTSTRKKAADKTVKKAETKNDGLYDDLDDDIPF